MDRPSASGAAHRPSAEQSARSKSSHAVSEDSESARQSLKPAIRTIRLEPTDAEKAAIAAKHAMAQADPTRRDEATKALKELEALAQKVNDHRTREGAFKEASVAYKQMMRGRYEYLNDFMEEMQQEPEELKKMTKRQELRLMHKMRMQADSTKYIVGSFIGGTALCAGVFYGTWVYTKMSMNVKDGSEYAEKMRQVTPSTKAILQQGSIGQMVVGFKEFTMEWLENKDSFRRFKRVMRAGFGDLQSDIQRRPSAGPDSRFLNKAVSGLHSRISGRIDGGRPSIADDIVAKVDAEAAGKTKRGWGWGYFSPMALKAPPLDTEPPLDSVAYTKRSGN